MPAVLPGASEVPGGPAPEAQPLASPVSPLWWRPGAARGTRFRARPAGGSGGWGSGVGWRRLCFALSGASTAARTFDGAPLGFPAEDPLPVDLVLVVAAHHGERDHLLGAGAVRRGPRRSCPGPHSPEGVLRAPAPPFPSDPEGRSHPPPPAAGTALGVTHPELLVHQPVLCVLVELLLGVHVDAVGQQVGGDLGVRGRDGAPSVWQAGPATTSVCLCHDPGVEEGQRRGRPGDRWLPEGGTEAGDEGSPTRCLK